MGLVTTLTERCQNLVTTASTDFVISTETDHHFCSICDRNAEWGLKNECTHTNQQEERVNMAECWWKTERAGVVSAKVFEEVSFFPEQFVCACTHALAHTLKRANVFVSAESSAAL